MSIWHLVIGFSLIFIFLILLMSIYSGFPTRKDETNYNQLLARLIQLLQAHLLEVMPTEKIENSKLMAYARVISKMQQYEQHKYLPPKFSQLLHPLSSLIGLPTKLDNDTNESAFESPPQKLKSFNSNSPLNTINDIKGKNMTVFKMTHKRDSFVQNKQTHIRKQSRGSDSVTKKRQRKFQTSFYNINQRKIKEMHQKYHSKVQQSNYVNQRILEEQDDHQLNFRSQTESPAQVYKSLKASKYDPANKYGIIHLKALKQAQEQLKVKTSTPKQPSRMQFT